MLRKLVSAIIMFVAAAVLVGWAVANREPVTISFDPFDRSTPTVTVPLFLFGFLILIAGVVVGGAAAWLRQGKWRRANSRLAAEVAALKGDLDRAKRFTTGSDAGMARGARRAGRKLPAA